MSSVKTSHCETYHNLEVEEITHVRDALRNWYLADRRKLPWRGDQPPYESKLEADKLTAAAESQHKRQKISDFFSAKGPQPSSSSISSTASSLSSAPSSSSISSTASSLSSALSSTSTPRTVSPYGVWVSEVMLQQTRVETVIDYYQKWMAAFPDLQSLAAASLDEVNAQWAGLGYYRRAKYLHKGAQMVVDDLGGKMPPTAAELRKIPGIGPYTAGAIASIAFSQPEPVVDGNVIRVLSRLRAIAAPPNSRVALKLHWQLAGQLVDPVQPGDFNQALMELGARICTPKSPRCVICPVQSVCLAFRESAKGVRPAHRKPVTSACEVCEEDDATPSVCRYPRPKPKAKVKEVTLAVAVALRQSKGQWEALLVKRPDSGLLAGQWGFPAVECPDSGDGTPELVDKLMSQVPVASGGTMKDLVVFRRDVTAETGRKGKRKRSSPSSSTAKSEKAKSVRSRGLVHVFSHVRHTMLVEALTVEGIPEVSQDADAEYKWQNLFIPLKSMGLTSGVRKVKDPQHTGATNPHQPNTRLCLRRSLSV